MFNFKKRNKKEQERKEPVLVVVITNIPFSELYQEILRDNGIKFICRQRGAGGYIKLLTGGLLCADDIYVNPEDYNKARELYEMYANIEKD